MKVKDAQFFAVVSSFLNVYLVKNRSCSSNTVKSYEDNQKWKYRFHLLCMYLGRQFRLHRVSLRISLSWDH